MPRITATSRCESFDSHVWCEWDSQDFKRFRLILYKRNAIYTVDVLLHYITLHRRIIVLCVCVMQAFCIWPRAARTLRRRDRSRRRHEVSSCSGESSTEKIRSRCFLDTCEAPITWAPFHLTFSPTPWLPWNSSGENTALGSSPVRRRTLTFPLTHISSVQYDALASEILNCLRNNSGEKTTT